jgi:hypothetical protein
MGHENIETTMKYYVQIPEEYEKEAIERLKDFGKKMTDRVTFRQKRGQTNNV